MHRGRSATTEPKPEVSAEGEDLRLHFPPGWLEDHPLTRLELEEEAERLGAAGVNLEVC
jgi:exopolyphosphatase/guanosine-5'-triphosphate,3'-diphosphate pyrophosphatase